MHAYTFRILLPEGVNMPAVYSILDGKAKSARPPRLLDRMRQVLRTKHYAYSLTPSSPLAVIVPEAKGKMVLSRLALGFVVENSSDFWSASDFTTLPVVSPYGGRTGKAERRPNRAERGHPSLRHPQ